MCDKVNLSEKLGIKHNCHEAALRLAKVWAKMSQKDAKIIKSLTIYSTPVATSLLMKHFLNIFETQELQQIT